MINLENESKETDGKKLILEIEDDIIVKFCELNGGMEFAMPIIRKQYDRLKIDFKNPKKEELEKLVESLVEVTESLKGELVAKEERKLFLDLLNKI